MNKKFLSMAAAAMMFAACSDDLKVDQAVPEIAQNPTEATAEQVPVQFGVYMNRATTRAGMSGQMTSNTLVNDSDPENPTYSNWDGTNWSGLEKSGFGVFAYYTNSDLYDDTYKPNFMYNQRVYKKDADGVAGNWTYEPVRYWPNEFGSNAVSDEVDRVSFFAYAPYVSVNPSTGSVNGNGSTYAEDNGDSTVGIVGLSRNSASGDPLVKYIASVDPATAVDLTSAANKNKENPQAADRVNLTFSHALAALNVTIDAQVTDDNGATTIDSETTKIYVRSITFEGFTNKGALNLNDGNWYDFSGQNSLDGSVTVYDGRADGKEALLTASNETYLGLNDALIQVDASYGESSAKAGVTTTAVNLFNSATVDAPIYVIPTGQEMRVTIVYDVETLDSNLPGYLSGSTTHGISVENAITKSIPGFKLDKGSLYTLNLHLGMNTVQFDATVSPEWPTTPSIQEVGLPEYQIGTIDDLKNDINNAADLTELETKFLHKYVDSEGNITTGAGTKTIGMIAYISKTAVDAAFTDSRILVLSNKEVSKAWRLSTAKNAVNSTNDLTSLSTWNSDYDAAPLNGYTNTQTILGLLDSNNESDLANYPAFEALSTEFDDLTSVFGTTATWFIPSAGQMIKMGLRAGTIDDYKITEQDKAKSAYWAIGATSGIYWSSSEANATVAWVFYYSVSSFGGSAKTNSGRGRPVFAY